MWSRPEKPVLIDASQLCVGLFVWIDLPWDKHPFIYNKFRITGQAQIEEIRSLHTNRIFYYPNKSETTPGPRQETPAAPDVQQAVVAVEEAAIATHNVALVNAKQHLKRKQKDAAALADRGWERAAKQVREGLLGLSRNPRQAGESLAELSRDTAKKIAGGSEVLLHLLGDKAGEGPQFHALNVMTLSMILGKALALPESDLADLAMGSMAHDVGKVKVPLHLLKAATRAKHEEDFYRAHCAYGAEIAAESGAFSDAAIAIVRDHHEFVDGSGFPKGCKGSSLAAGIVAVVNRYDRLCCPESPDKAAMMPAEALAFLYAKEKARFDPRVFGLLIRMLGVYPPGTIVQLNDGSLGLVVSPGTESLRPKVLIYDPELPKDDAPVVDLIDMPELKIFESLRPATLPRDVIEWLNPRQRLSYFFSVESVNS